MKEVICNRASDERCPNVTCKHFDLHLTDPFAFQCTKWGECLDENEKVIFKVRCISTDSKQGKKIIEELKGEL